DRQEPSDLWTGRGGGTDGHGHDRGGGCFWSAGQYDPCAFVRGSRHHDGQRVWSTVGDGTEPINGVGADVADLNHAGFISVLGVPHPRQLNPVLQPIGAYEKTLTKERTG